MSTQPDSSDHSERSFTTEEQLREIGASRRPWRTSGADDASVGEDDFESDDHVLDLAVTRRVLTGAAARDPTTNGRDVETLRKVADRHSVVRESLLEIGSEGAGTDVDDQGHVVDVVHTVQCRHVENDSTVARNRGAAHTATTTGRGERDSFAVADGGDPRHLVGRRRTAYDRTLRRDFAVERPTHGEGPPVATRLCSGHVVGVGVADGRQFGENRVGDRTRRPATRHRSVRRDRDFDGLGDLTHTTRPPAPHWPCSRVHRSR